MRIVFGAVAIIVAGCAANGGTASSPSTKVPITTTASTVVVTGRSILDARAADCFAKYPLPAGYDPHNPAAVNLQALEKANYDRMQCLLTGS